jgi:hypothetical protein
MLAGRGEWLSRPRANAGNGARRVELQTDLSGRARARPGSMART